MPARSAEPKGPPQPLAPEVFKPVETMAARMWPGVPVVPFMSAGATDGAFLAPAGIPTYGVSGIFGEADGNGAHGLNENIRARSLYEGRDFLYEVVKIYVFLFLLGVLCCFVVGLCCLLFFCCCFRFCWFCVFF